MHAFVKKTYAVLGAAVLCLNGALAQGDYFKDYLPYSVYPNEQWDNSTKYLALARRYAGTDLLTHYEHACILMQAYAPLNLLGQSGTTPAFVPASEVFQGVYFVGQSRWSAWAIATTQGIVLIDSMNSPEEAERLIVGGIAKFGLEGADIKTVIITHEHGDHYRGAKYLQDNFGVAVGASPIAWEAMVKPTIAQPAPARDGKAFDIADGQVLDFGNVTITSHLTPGHTNGTISLFITVTDQGTEQKHLAGLVGGAGYPATGVALAQQARSYWNFGQLSEAKGADVLISNHQQRDRSLFHIDALAHRQCKNKCCNMPHPFVVGVNGYKRWNQLMSMCVRVHAARNNINLVE